MSLPSSMADFGLCDRLLQKVYSKATHCLLSYFCQLNILKGTPKAAAVNFLRLDSQSGDEHPSLFNLGFSPLGRESCEMTY